MWAFFSSMTNKIILEFQSWRHHLNCIGFLYWNQFCLNPNQVEKWHLPQGVSQRSAWMLALVSSQEKTIQLSLFNCQLFQLSLFPDENKAKEMNPSCFSDCRLAQCSLACSHHIHCSHLLHPQVLVVACFTFVVKKIILPIYTQHVPFKRGAHRILYLRVAPC